jgi:hypothetical protein
LAGFEMYFYGSTKNLFAFAYSLSPSGKEKIMTEIFNTDEVQKGNSSELESNILRSSNETKIQVTSELQIADGLFTEPEYIIDEQIDEPDGDNESEQNHYQGSLTTMDRAIQGYKNLLRIFVRSTYLKDELAKYQLYLKERSKKI